MPAPTTAAIAERLGALRQRIEELGGSGVEVVAVTKAFDAAVVVAAARAGCRAIGENYAQELLAKLPAIDALGVDRPALHFVGHVQSNKVGHLAGVVDVWHTVDRASLADRIGRHAHGARVMLQVNTTGEDAKSGCAPADTDALLDYAIRCGLTVEGLMTIGPTDGRGTEQSFRSLRVLADRLGLASCSMGMSGDYEIAVAQGATHVRIGTLLFGGRRGG